MPTNRFLPRAKVCSIHAAPCSVAHCLLQPRRHRARSDASGRALQLSATDTLMKTIARHLTQAATCRQPRHLSRPRSGFQSAPLLRPLWPCASLAGAAAMLPRIRRTVPPSNIHRHRSRYFPQLQLLRSRSTELPAGLTIRPRGTPNALPEHQASPVVRACLPDMEERVCSGTSGSQLSLLRGPRPPPVLGLLCHQFSGHAYWKGRVEVAFQDRGPAC